VLCGLSFHFANKPLIKISYSSYLQSFVGLMACRLILNTYVFTWTVSTSWYYSADYIGEYKTIIYPWRLVVTVGTIRRRLRGAKFMPWTDLFFQRIIRYHQQIHVSFSLYICNWYYTVFRFRKKHSLIFSCITLRKSNQFEWKLQTE